MKILNELHIFKNNEFGNLRVVQKDNQTWFVGKDVADILGYQNGSRDINRHVAKEDRHKTMVFDGNQNKETIVINESGLYSLILSSKLPTAKKFKHWVTSDVLPIIRKHGAYMTPETIEKTLTSPDFIIRLATELKKEKEARAKLEIENNQKNQIIGELKPKADYTDLILQSKGTVPITAIAKDYGISGRKMNKILHELKVIYKTGNQWFLYAKWQSHGYTHSKTINFTHRDGRKDVTMHTEWTQKGRLFLYNLLKKNGIIPVIER